MKHCFNLQVCMQHCDSKFGAQSIKVSTWHNSISYQSEGRVFASYLSCVDCMFSVYPPSFWPDIGTLHPTVS